MKVSKASSYALHSMMYMVRHLSMLPASIKEVSRAEGIPATYLAKIFQQLVRSNIVKSGGKSESGYVFAREPSDISVLELVRAIEGEGFFTKCFMKHDECGGTRENCRIYNCWQDMMGHLEETLGKTSLIEATWQHPNHSFVTTKQNGEVKETATGKTARSGDVNCAK